MGNLFKNSIYPLFNRITFFFSDVKKEYYFTGLLALFALLIFMLNIEYPLFGDDWRYSFIHGSGLSLRINSFTDSVYSQYNHYMTWGGRSVVHFIDECLLRLPVIYSDIINSLMFIILLLMVYKLVNLKHTLNPFLFLCLSLLIWIFQPAFGHSFLWLTGSANYLWGTVILISYLYFYISAFIRGKSRDSILQMFFAFIGGVLAGWTNENSVVGAIFILISIVIYCKVKGEFLPRWFYIGITGLIIGFLIMIIAPGNYVRMEGAVSGNVFYSKSPILYYLARIRDILFESYKVLIPLGTIYILITILLSFQNGLDRRYCFLSIIFVLASLISTFVMLATPDFPLRVLTCPVIFFIIAIGILAIQLDKSVINLRILKAGLICLVLYFIPYYYEAYQDVSRMGKIFSEREALISRQEDKSNYYLVSYERFIPKTKFTMMYDLSPDPNQWDNMCYAIYYGIKKVRVGDTFQ